MKMLVTMFTDEKESDLAEKMHQEARNQYTEEGLYAIYDEVVDRSSEYKNDIKTATVKGALIGATAVGLIGIGILGYNKFSNYRKKKKIKKED